MKKLAAHTHAWEIFETVFGIPVLISLILGYLFSLPLSMLLPRAAAIGAGIILLLAGLAIVIMTRRQFSQESQPTVPGIPTSRLITTGVFSWSRNPLYLGGVVALIGVAALINSLWLIILLIPAIIAAHFILIVPEEQYLEARFGESYRQYARHVRRWIGRRR